MGGVVTSQKGSLITTPITPSVPNQPLFSEDQLQQNQQQQDYLAALQALLLKKLHAQQASVVQHTTEKGEVDKSDKNNKSGSNSKVPVLVATIIKITSNNNDHLEGH